MVLNYKEAKQKLLASDINGCRQFFAESGCVLELAYIELLNDNLDKSEELFRSIILNDVRAHWALVMISFIKGIVSDYPSYFEIRNFLEIDLNILINYYKGEYAEKIVRYADYMFQINPEVNKYIGRVFYNNDLKEQAMYFLKRSKDCFFQDPELHFLLATAYLDKKDMFNAFKSLYDCLNVLPDYYPAVDLLNKIKQNIE